MLFSKEVHIFSQSSRAAFRYHVFDPHLSFFLWQNNATTVRQIIMHAMAEWYMMVENDQTRLSRILDVAQDLKALSLLLNAQPFPFVIDLACLAYRRK